MTWWAEVLSSDAINPGQLLIKWMYQITITGDDVAWNDFVAIPLIRTPDLCDSDKPAARGIVEIRKGTDMQNDGHAWSPVAIAGGEKVVDVVGYASLE